MPKRRFQKGTFIKRNGQWVGMWRVDTLQTDGTIRRDQHSKTFVGLSERAARAAFQPILDVVNSANHATPPVPKTSLTLKKLATEWRDQVAGALKSSSRKSVESHLRRHIVPLLGDCALTELTVKRVQAKDRREYFVDGLFASQFRAQMGIPRSQVLSFRPDIASEGCKVERKMLLGGRNVPDCVFCR